MTQTKPFNALDYLQSEEDIAVYLQQAVEMANEENDQNILLKAIATAAKAKGMLQLATDAGVSRESLYKSLAPNAKPRFETIVKILSALGCHLTIEPNKKVTA
ncbi:MAG: putative addiction module antidote protein [Neisseriaceae bacterium]|nr:putative addiction module antidote protein [Neisseriaceae bacterium]MBQ9182864.1 putative addiction module antidote protein [Neisseriaceae bacterium]MBR0128516.1 putative addiction module antidote protein [Neisseriaceae bacterium]